MIQESGYGKYQVSIVLHLRKTKRQPRRCAEITQLWRQVVFRVFFRRSRKSIYGYDLGEWVCQISGLYRFSIKENKKGIQGDMQKQPWRISSTVRPVSLKNKRQSKIYEKTTLTQQFWRQGIFRIPSSKKQRKVFKDQGVGITYFRSLSFF